MPDIFFLLKSKWINIFCWSPFVTVFSNIEFSSFMFRKKLLFLSTNYISWKTDTLTHLKNCFLGHSHQSHALGYPVIPSRQGWSNCKVHRNHYRGLVQMQSPFRPGEGPETAFPTSPRLCQHCWPTHCKGEELSKKISNPWSIPK